MATIRELLGLSKDATQEEVNAALDKEGFTTEEEAKKARDAAAAAARKEAASKSGTSDEDKALLAKYKKQEAIGSLLKDIHGVKNKDLFVKSYLTQEDGTFVEKVTPEIMEKAKKESPSWFDETIDPFTGKTVETKTEVKSSGGTLMGGAGWGKKD